MLAVTILYRDRLLDEIDLAEVSKFKWETMRIVATHMDAVDPATGETTGYGADSISFVDLVMLPYSGDYSCTTTALLGTIVAYDWPDRMANLHVRMEAITRAVRAIIPFEVSSDDLEVISFTFLPKSEGASFSAWSTCSYKETFGSTITAFTQVHNQVIVSLGDRQLKWCIYCLKVKLKLADSVHLATALHEAAFVFTTNDQDIAKLNIAGIEVASLWSAMRRVCWVSDVKYLYSQDDLSFFYFYSCLLLLLEQINFSEGNIMGERGAPLDHQEASFVAETVKPFIDAESNANPADKATAGRATNEAIAAAERVYPVTSDAHPDTYLDHDKAEDIAHLAKPAIDKAADSRIAADEAGENKGAVRDRLYDDLAPVEDDNAVLSHPDFTAAERAARDADKTESKDREFADSVVDVLDASYVPPEDK